MPRQYTRIFRRCPFTRLISCRNRYLNILSELIRRDEHRFREFTTLSHIFDTVESEVIACVQFVRAIVVHNCHQVVLPR